MRNFLAAAAILAFATVAVRGEPRGQGTVSLVDGTETQCEVLFEHPNAKVLVVRSARNSTVQGLPLAEVHKVTVAGKTTEYSPKRALTEDRKKAREADRLWGDEVSPKQIGRYGDQKWEKKPLIVWARPGVSADAMKPESWLDETGKPLTAGPWKLDPPNSKGGASTGEFDGDVLLPAASEAYDAIQPGNRDHLGAFRIRHLTVENNAGYNVRYTVRGNLWIKQGSAIGAGTQTGGIGSGEGKHTFMRFCGPRRPGKKGPVDPEWAGVSHWVMIDAGESGSVEMVGKSGGAGDRLTLEKGTLIVSEDSYIGNGPRASFYSKPGTTTVLLDGAAIGCRDRVLCGRRATYGVAGTLMFGTPEHPLRRDLRFEGTLFNYEDLAPEASPGQRTGGASFVLGSTGRMAVHSADPTKARVIFSPRPEDAPYSSYAVGPRAGGREMPTGVAAIFTGQTDFDGVVFDGFYKAGIVVSPQARAKWKNVSFGQHNQGKPDELFRTPGEAGSRQ